MSGLAGVFHVVPKVDFYCLHGRSPDISVPSVQSSFQPFFCWKFRRSSRSQNSQLWNHLLPSCFLWSEVCAFVPWVPRRWCTDMPPWWSSFLYCAPFWWEHGRIGMVCQPWFKTFRLLTSVQKREPSNLGKIWTGFRQRAWAIFRRKVMRNYR